MHADARDLFAPCAVHVGCEDSGHVDWLRLMLDAQMDRMLMHLLSLLHGADGHAS